MAYRSGNQNQNKQVNTITYHKDVIKNSFGNYYFQNGHVNYISVTTFSKL